LNQIKAQKLDQLIGPQIASHSSPENLNSRKCFTSDSEKSVLSNGLNFVPISKTTDEFSVKQDIEKFLRHVQLKAYFHDKEDDSNTSNNNTFKTLLIRNFASLDVFIKKCRQDINKLNFNRSTKFSNLSSEEWSALKSLSKRGHCHQSGQQRRCFSCLADQPLPKRSFVATF